jgi:tRNA G26 N,N-dimethylase Trm1
LRPLFRVYRCSKCEYIDYAIIANKDVINRCSLCGAEIKHTSKTFYASSEDEAANKTRILIQSKSIKHPSPKPTRSLGVKKRILEMLISLIELNDGKPVFLADILEECSQASISKERVLHFIDILSSEGFIQNKANGILVNLEVEA